MTAKQPQSPDTAQETALPAGPPPGARDVTFLEDPVIDQLLRAVVTLTMELSVTRERLRALEQVLDENGLAAAAKIEELVLTPQEDDARRASREKLIHSILGPVVSRLARD